LVFAVSAGLEQPEHNVILGFEIRRFWRKPLRIGLAQQLHILF
jgi:hypothetical protein